MPATTAAARLRGSTESLQARNLVPQRPLYAWRVRPYCRRAPPMATRKNDDELDRLEEMMRVVKNKYDQFFSGIGKMPPPWTERRSVDIAIYEMNKQKIRDNARR